MTVYIYCQLHLSIQHLSFFFPLQFITSNFVIRFFAVISQMFTVFLQCSPLSYRHSFVRCCVIVSHSLCYISRSPPHSKHKNLISNPYGPFFLVRTDSVRQTAQTVLRPKLKNILSLKNTVQPLFIKKIHKDSSHVWSLLLMIIANQCRRLIVMLKLIIS